MKTLIVYYSRSGYTRAVAEQTAEKLEDCDVYGLKPAKGYAGLRGFLRGGREALKEIPAELADRNGMPDAAAYDLVVCATPVWAGHMSPPVLGYLTEYGNRMKKAAYIVTRGGADPCGQVVEAMEKASGVKRCAQASIGKKDGNPGAAVDEFARAVRAC